MKKINLYKIINIILVVVYVASLILQKTIPFLDLSLSDYWFPALLIILSFSMLFKFIIFNSDSSLWLFITLLLVGLGLFVLHYNNLNLGEYWVVILSIISLASLVVGLAFKEIYQIKVSVFVALISVSFYLYFFKVLMFWWCLAILLLSILVSLILVIKILPQRWYANKERK